MYIEEKFDYYLTGTQARKLVQGLKNNPAKYGKVSISVRTAVYHYGRAEVGDTGSFKDDTYKDTYYMASAAGLVNLSWKDFLATCKDADEFSARKQELFAEKGEADNTEKHGTGINVQYHFCPDYGFTNVYLG